MKDRQEQRLQLKLQKQQMAIDEIKQLKVGLTTTLCCGVIWEGVTCTKPGHLDILCLPVHAIRHLQPCAVKHPV